MNKKALTIITAILLFAVMVTFKKGLLEIPSNIWGINDWGYYIFMIPFGYCLIAATNPSPSILRRNLLYFTAGVFITILLGFGDDDPFILQKIVTVLLGSSVLGILIKFNSKQRVL